MFPGKYKYKKKKKKEVRTITITTFSKDSHKGVCHRVDIIQKETKVFLPDFQTRIFFYFSLNSCFNPAVILHKALQHSLRHQLNKFLSCDGIWLTKPLLNLLNV